MKNKHTFLAASSLVGGILLTLAAVVLFSIQPVSASASRSIAAIAAAPFLDDFEGGIPSGFVPFSDSGDGSGSSTAVTLTTTTNDLPTVPPITSTSVVSFAFNVAASGGWGGGPGYAGVTRNFTTSQDWSSYQDISFWYSGSNSGMQYRVELKSEGVDANASNRFVYTFADDFTGWRFFSIPFASFVNRTDYTPGPNPAAPINLAKMWGYSILLPGGAQGTIHLDNVTITGYANEVDFEGGIPSGFVAFADSLDGSGSSTVVTLTTTTADLPTIPPLTNTAVVSFSFNVAASGGWGGGPGYAGVTHDFAATVDWESYDGLSFWYSGSNSGVDYRVELKSEGSSAGASNRFVYTFTDDFTGWRFFSIPFTSFVNRTDYTPGPNPSAPINLAKMWGYSILLPGGAQGTFYLDEVAVYGGNAPSLTADFTSPTTLVNEGESATISVTLNFSATTPVTVSYATSDGTALAGSDYTAASGQLTFAPGITEATFTVATLDDADAEGSQTVILTLSDPISAGIGSNNPATLVIADNDIAELAPENIQLIDNFSGGVPDGIDSYGNTIGFIPWTGGGAAITLTTPLIARTDPLSLPIQTEDNYLLQVASNIGSGWAGYTRLFTNAALDTWLSQNWITYEGVSFWVYGSGSGGDLNFDIFDNKTTTGDSCERWTYVFADDFTGWRYFAVPFNEFTRKSWQPGGAPNDGLTLTEVWGYAFGFPANVGARTHSIDNVGVMLRTTVVDDFANGVPTGTDSFGNDIGFVTWGDSANTFLTTTQVISTSPLAFPLPLGKNEFLKVDYDIASSGWGGFTHLFANESVDTWISQNWLTYEGMSFWVYGAGSGGEINIDIFDNKTTTGDSCERWTYLFADDFTGWRYFAVPFNEFTRKSWQPGGAPNDGLTLTEVWGYAFGFPANVGARTNYLELVTVYGSTTPPAQEPKVSFGAMGYSAIEGESESLTIQLNVAITYPVTVSYAATSGAAIANRDYLAIEGTHTFAPGEIEFTFSVETLDDIKYEGSENIGLQLTDAINVELGSVNQVNLAIQDNDPFNPLLIDDFEIFPYAFESWDGIGISTTEIVSPSSMALPGQWSYENVLTVEAKDTSTRAFTPAGAGFSRTFAESEDWSSTDGMEFWYYGQNSGQNITVTLQGNRQPDPSPEDWTLVWSDEFEGNLGAAVNPAKWTHEIGGGGWGNSEWEYYTDSPENSSVDGSGNLLITARAVATSTTPLDCWYGDCTHTSARLVTANKFEFTYGRAEARLKVPYGQGIWPAFWSLGNDIGTTGWPGSGEIDIMENIGREPNIVHGTIHGPGYSGGNGIGGGYTLDSGNLADDFHVFAIEWEPDEIRWYIDGTQYFTATVDDIPTGTEWVYDHPFFLILNVAVGGGWPGYPDDTTIFPQTMTVDYVRVYQGPDTAERHEALFSDHFSGWQKVELPFTAFNRSAEQPAGAPNDGFDPAEIWGYGFGLPAGIDLPVYIDQVARFNGAAEQPGVQFSASQYTVDEGGVATVTVTLDASSSAPITVTYTTADGTAIAESDYLTSTGALVFAPGEMSKTFQVTTLDDASPEGGETISLRLSNPQGATLGAVHEATLTIQDGTFIIYLPLIYKP